MHVLELRPLPRLIPVEARLMFPLGGFEDYGAFEKILE